MTGVTPTEFLLARIADDEAPTWVLVPYRCEPGCCAPAGWVGHRCLVCVTEEFGGTVAAITETAAEHDERIHRRSRVMVECEAKRRIVDLHELVERDGCDTCWICGPTEDVSWQVKTYGAGWPCETLQALTLPYVDHPDYQQEWRP